MATYEEIYGKRVEVLDTDPTLTSAYEGQVWYNSATGTLKTVVSSAVAVTTTNMPTATRAYGSIGATQSAFIVACGANPGTNYSTNSFEYNGLGWTTNPSATNSRDSTPRGSLGTTTAGLVFGGLGPSIVRATCEKWDGSSWSESGDLSDSRGASESFGTQTACVTTGGYNDFSPPYWTNATEEFNGSSWTSGTATPLNTANGCGVGTSTAGIIVGQQEQPGNSYPGKATVTQTRNYDGTSWSNGGTINMATNVSSVAGTSSACRKAGGASPAPASYTNQEEWDNTSWTTGPALATDFSNGGGAGTSTAAVYAGGQTPPGNLATTQEVSKTINSLTAAAWASANALGTGRESMSSAGTQTAALAVGGRVGPPGGTTAVEDYDGSSWESAPVLNTARQYAGGCGTQTAAITYGGGPPEITTTEEFNGSSWSTQPNSMSTARRAFASFGIQTAAVAAGGQTGTAVTSATEEYNGTSWSTSPGSLAQARQYFAGAGIESSGLAFGGSDHPNSTKYTNTEEYGGTSWTTGGVLPTGTSGLMGCGATNTAALAFGGYQPSKVATTVGYDGTAWSSRPSMGGATAEGSGAGTSIAALSIGGSPAETGVEEFTGETESINAKTLTTE